MEEELFESQVENLWWTIYEKLPIMVFIMDRNGDVCMVNERAEKDLGYPKEELIGRTVLNVFYEDDKENVLKQFQACLDASEEVLLKWRFRKVKKSGEMIWVGESVSRIMIGGEIYVIVVCDEITNIMESEMALEASEKMHRAFLEATIDFAFLKDAEGRYVMANGSLCKFFE